MSRQDVLKVFMGNLHADVNKPKILSLLRFHGLVPHEVHVPKPRVNKLAIAFAEFDTPEEAQSACVALNQQVDAEVSPGRIQAQGGQHGSLYYFRPLPC